MVEDYVKVKKIKFLQFYFLRVIKKWWLIFAVFIPALKPLVLELDATYFKSLHEAELEIVFNWLSSWWVWIALIIFWFIHLIIIYQLWNNPDETKVMAAQYDNISESYATILRSVDRFLPDKSDQIRESLVCGYKCLTEPAKRDIKTAISTHFNAYKNIKDFLISYFNSDKINFQITVEISQIKLNFENNLSKLESHNISAGQNVNLTAGEHDIRKLIDDITVNLNSLFAYF